MKIKNLLKIPYGIRTSAGVVMVKPGDVYEGKFTPDQEAAIKASPETWEIGGQPDAAPASNGELEAIAALFNDPAVTADNVKYAVATLLAEKPKQTGDETTHSMTLAEAVAALDDANPDHWTQAGLPAIAAVEAIYGDNVARADLDALDPPRLRKPAA